MFAAWTMAAAASLGNGPYGMPAYPAGLPAGMPAGMSYEMSPGMSPSMMSGGVTSSGFGGSSGEQLYSYEQQEPWLHGYFQEIPAYGGYHSFRPYNYKHVLSQSQTAAGYGMSPVMPYSQQFWHRYSNRANLSPYVNEPTGPAPVPPGTAPIPLRSAAALPQSFPGFGMTAPAQPAGLGPQPPAATAAQNVVPAEWQAGPVIIPAQGSGRSSDPRSRWGRLAD